MATFTFQDNKEEDNTSLICDDVLSEGYQQFLLDEELNDNPASRKLYVHKNYAHELDNYILGLRIIRRTQDAPPIDQDSGIS